jgi:hypothetical protein
VWCGAVIELESSKGRSRREQILSVGSNDSLINHLPKASPEIYSLFSRR